MLHGDLDGTECEKPIEKIWWFGYDKEKASKQERRKHYAGNDKDAARSVYRNITEDIWKSFKDSKKYQSWKKGLVIPNIL